MTTTTKTLIQMENPVSQSVDSVKALLSWRGRGTDPMPSKIEFVNEGEGSRLVLVLSNKKDTYYTVTPRACSCPSAVYHPEKRCKHARKYFPQDQPATVAETGCIRPTGKWPGGMNGPVDMIPGEKAVSSPLSVIDCHDSTDLDAAYHSIKEDKVMWPAEA